MKRNFSELAGMVAYFRERKIAASEELLFWVGFVLGYLLWYRAHLRPPPIGFFESGLP